MRPAWSPHWIDKGIQDGLANVSIPRSEQEQRYVVNRCFPTRFGDKNDGSVGLSRPRLLYQHLCQKILCSSSHMTSIVKVIRHFYPLTLYSLSWYCLCGGLPSLPRSPPPTEGSQASVEYSMRRERPPSTIPGTWLYWEALQPASVSSPCHCVANPLRPFRIRGHLTFLCRPVELH